MRDTQAIQSAQASSNPQGDPDWGALVRALSDRLFAQALTSASLPVLVERVCAGLVEGGLPLARCQLAVTSLHPLLGAKTYTWQGQAAVTEEGFGRGRDPSPQWQRSPFQALIEGPERWMLLDTGNAAMVERFPLLADLRANHGITAYLAEVVAFAPLGTSQDRPDGMALSWSTTRPGGFTASMVEALRRLTARLAICVKIAVREETGRNIATAYLGPEAGARVLEGQIGRGAVEVIDAVFLFADMRDSSGLAVQLPPAEFLDLLNGYFERIGRAVVDEGGAILQFAGDALLAVFRIGPDAMAPEAAARAAIRAARRARDEQPYADEAFPFGIGLHRGTALYGNIGLADRLAFTVIGADVNAAARVEAQTRALGTPVLASAAVASLAPEALVETGTGTLRGMTGEWRLFRLAE